jgi:flavin-dependent dehydrogenase
LGADVRLNAEVRDIDFDTTKVLLRNGDEISGNVIIAADGE